MHEMSTDELDALAKEVAGSGGKWRFDKEHRMLFIDKIVGGSIPKEFIAPIDAGIREAMENGMLAGYEMVDIAVLLIDGSYHDVDSSEMAFKIAGSMAFKEACGKAQPVLLEPIMKVEVVTPEEYMPRVFGDLNSRRCHPIQGTESARRRATSFASKCRWPRCSGTPPMCAAARRAAPASPCISRIMRKRPARWPRK